MLACATGSSTYLGKYLLHTIVSIRLDVRESMRLTSQINDIFIYFFPVRLNDQHGRGGVNQCILIKKHRGEMLK